MRTKFQREKKRANSANGIQRKKKRANSANEFQREKKNGVDCNFYDYNETLRGVLCFIIIIKIFRARLEKIGAEND